MPKFRREIYLGLRRKTIYEKLAIDPFEEKYPCKQYPLYISRERTGCPLIIEPKINLKTSDSKNWTKSDLLSAISDSLAQLDNLMRI